MLKPPPWVRLIAALGLACWAGCANVTQNFGTVNLDITVVRGGKPAPYQRLVIWIEETRMEKVTDAQGKLVLTESYSWEAQTLDVPGVGPLRHSPKPNVEVSLSADPEKKATGPRTVVSEPKNAWKMSILFDLGAQ